MISSHSSIEIYTAIQAGKTVIISEQGAVYTVSEISEDKISIFIELTGFGILFYDIDINKTIILKNIITMATVPQPDGTTDGNILSVVDGKPEWTKPTSGVVAQPEAPSDTSVLWLDTDDNSTDSGGNVNLSKPSLVDYLSSVHCPVQLPANEETDSDFNLHTFADFGSGFHSYFDDLVARYPHYLVRELMGNDASGTLPIYRYTLGKHYWSAWYKENYPRMYAWKNGDTVIYSESISPRIGDNMYTAPVIGEKYGSQAGTETDIVKVPAKVVIVKGQRYSQSGGEWKAAADTAALVIPTEFYYDSNTGRGHKISVEITNADWSAAYDGVYIGDSATTFPRVGALTRNGNVATLGASGAVDFGKTYSHICLAWDGSSTMEDVTITVDGEPVDVIVTTNIEDATKATYATTKEVEVENETVNVPAKAVIVRGQRYSHSGKAWKAAADAASLVIPAEFVSGNDTQELKVTNATFHTYYTGVYTGDTPSVFDRTGIFDKTASEGTIQCAGLIDIGKKFGIVFLSWDGSATFANTTVTLDGVSLDVIVTDSTDDTSKTAHATTKEVEVETETVPAAVTAVSATNRSRTINGMEFVRYETGDVEPTLYYTAAYNPYTHLVDINGKWENGGFTIEGNVLTGYDAKPLRYIRYPFGDLTKDKKPLIHMTIIANEHGGATEPAIPTVTVARLIRDLCRGQCSSDNPVYRYLRDNVQITFIPSVNPHGLNKFASGDFSGYRNANNININRNYDTPGWDYCYNNQDIDGNDALGPYPGSENETQYVMNTMVDSKADVAMSVHTISCKATSQRTRCMYQGQNPNGKFTQNKIEEIADDMKSSYNLDFIAYNPLECPPDTTAKSPSFITQCGAYGGIVEMQCHNPLATNEEATAQTTMFTADVMEQNYSLLLKFIIMWLSDYLEGTE